MDAHVGVDSRSKTEHIRSGICIIDSGCKRAAGDARFRSGVAIVVAPGGDIRVVPAADDDGLGHGTACAAVALEQAPRAVITPVRVFQDDLRCSRRVLTHALIWAASQKFHVVNVSLGTSNSSGVEALYDACSMLVAAGTMIVAAAGPVSPCFPAAFDNVIGVRGGIVPLGATVRRWRDRDARIMADGTRRHVRNPLGDVGEYQGASMAAAAVSGVVAGLREHHPEADMEQIVHMMLLMHGDHRSGHITRRLLQSATDDAICPVPAPVVP